MKVFSVVYDPKPKAGDHIRVGNLVIGTQTDTIVLVISTRGMSPSSFSGVVVKSDIDDDGNVPFTIGITSDTWSKSNFKLFRGTITLKEGS